jgi:hypothetical protein
MTAGEVATHLGVSVRRGLVLVGAGKFRRRRVGRFWLSSRPSVEARKVAPKDKGGRPRFARGGAAPPGVSQRATSATAPTPRSRRRR